MENVKGQDSIQLESAQKEVEMHCYVDVKDK